MAVFDAAVVKVTSYCDLNCSYCYMFQSNDLTFGRVPKKMSMETMTQFLARLSDYLTSADIEKFKIIFHGGEPTLWGRKNFEQFFDLAAPIRDRLSISVQTNLFSVDERLWQLLSENGATLGVSLDGPAQYHDTVRMDHRGQGSYERIVANLKGIRAAGYEPLVAGFLVVANPAMPPSDLFAWMKTWPIRRFDVLWPMQFNWDTPPWLTGEEESYASAPIYGRWFAELFRLWFENDDPTLYVRSFIDLIKYFLGGQSHGDSIVNSAIPYFVVNTDGEFELTDYCRPSADGATRTGHSVWASSLDAVAQDERFAYYLDLRSQLPESCHECAHCDVCGGGFLPGRFRSTDRGVAMRKSVLCHDHKYFYDSIKELLDPIVIRSPRKHELQMQSGSALGRVLYAPTDLNSKR